MEDALLAHDRIVRKNYIRLLTEASSRPGGWTTTTAEDNLACDELIKAHHLWGTAWCGRDPDYIAMIQGVTLQGRLFLGQLIREEREDSWWRRGLKETKVIAAFIVGALTPLAVDVIKAVIHSHWGIDVK